MLGYAQQRASSYPSGNWSAHTDRLPPAGPCQNHFGNSTDYRSDDSCPPTVDTSADHMDPTNMGGDIESPRPSDKECQVQSTNSQKRRYSHLAVCRLQKRYIFFKANNLLIAKFPRPSSHISNTVDKLNKSKSSGLVNVFMLVLLLVRW